MLRCERELAFLWSPTRVILSASSKSSPPYSDPILPPARSGAAAARDTEAAAGPSIDGWSGAGRYWGGTGESAAAAGGSAVARRSWGRHAWRRGSSQDTSASGSARRCVLHLTVNAGQTVQSTSQFANLGLAFAAAAHCEVPGGHGQGPDVRQV